MWSTGDKVSSRELRLIMRQLMQSPINPLWPVIHKWRFRNLNAMCKSHKQPSVETDPCPASAGQLASPAARVHWSLLHP